MGLVLRAENGAGPLRWRWLLSDEETGAPLASHVVDLDEGSEELAAFRDLYGFVRWRAAPGQPSGDHLAIARAVGAWTGRVLLGADLCAKIVAEAPVTVRVTAPATLRHLLMWPLELAHAGGRPLAARGDVSLVYDIAPGSDRRRKNAVGATLRVLAVFSQPTRTSMLALRQERYALTRLMRRIAARERAAVELRVVQYGVTRERLAEIADSQDGWDVLHLAGHGGPGQFLLEHADGSPDMLPVADLIELLRPARHQLKLAVVSACESAAETVAETLHLVGLDERAQDAAAGSEPGQAVTEATGVARALTRDLECAVLAMRYPVPDEFAVSLSVEFYEHLLIRKQDVDVAAARAVAAAVGTKGTQVRRALSLATLGVFGARSQGLRIEVPRTRPVLDPSAQKMAHFPDEPERFVGRTAAMATASAALAPRSRTTTVLLYGMAGSGKTACALELAYRHQDAFSVAAFWQAPTRADEWDGALADFANRLEIQLRDYQFTMSGHIGTEAALRAFLPRLQSVLRNNGLLLVLDNLETLLTPDGEWLDPRWGLLMTALSGHGGESRLILTSQVAPTGLGPGHAALPVHTLSLDESAVLARELPWLRALLHADDGPDGEEGPVRGEDTAQVAADRERLRRVLRVVQGHPKLLELADAAASDRGRLDAQLASAERAADGQRLEAFFREGVTALGAGQFLDALTGWTVTALGVLAPEALLMAEFLASLEDRDRLSFVIETAWPDLWREIGRPGEPPPSQPLLEALAAAALVEGEAELAADGRTHAGVRYRLHPGVAAAITATAGQRLRDAVDAVLAELWEVVAYQTSEEGSEISGVVTRAGLAAAPYLLRRDQWEDAGSLIEQVLARDESPATVQAALPTLRRIAAATGTPEDAALLARALRTVNPDEAERLLGEALNAAIRVGDYASATSIAGERASLLITAGQLTKALSALREAERWAKRAGVGPWTHLVTQGQRLWVLGLMGQHGRVLMEVNTIRAAMQQLPERADENETVSPWNVREFILSIGSTSAAAVGDWEYCLELNADVLASMRQRGAIEHDVTGARFNDVGPLIRLGRLEEADRVLAQCQLAFEEEGDMARLGKVFSARADLEDEAGRPWTAADLGRTALRLAYVLPLAKDIAAEHHSFANYLAKLGDDRAGQRAHRLAAALVRRLAGLSDDLGATVRVLGEELRADGADTVLPATVAEVVETVELTEGVYLSALLDSLETDSRVVAAALDAVLNPAADEQAGQLADVLTAGPSEALPKQASGFPRSAISDLFMA